MVLKSLNNLNIKRMVLETPEKAESDLPFDVERDITQEDWEKLEQETEEYRKNHRLGYFALHAIEIKILDTNVDLNLDKKAWGWDEARFRKR